jgi:hypothetical protein
MLLNSFISFWHSFLKSCVSKHNVHKNVIDMITYIGIKLWKVGNMHILPLQRDLLAKVQIFLSRESRYSGASLIRMTLIWMLHIPDDISGEQTIWRSIKCGSFIQTILLGTKVSGFTDTPLCIPVNRGFQILASIILKKWQIPWNIE